MSVIIAITYIALIWWAVHVHQKRKRERDSDLLDYPAADTYIENLNKKRLRLNEIERLITDIELHEAGRAEAPLYISWADTTGEEHSTHIYINSSAAVNRVLKELVQAERKNLRTSLSYQLLHTPLRHNGNVTQTTDNTARGEDQ